MTDNNYVIIITGPTAVGKSALAIQLAEYFGTQIISADSRQCYKELKIGVARPISEDLKKVPHYFIASHSVFEKIDASFFEKFALKKVEEIFIDKKVVIMVGGTGLYIRAFCEGLDLIPEIESVIRERIVKMFEEKGINWLQEELKLKDPAFYKAGEMLNPQRMMRALEVIEGTGQSILYFRKGKQVKRDFIILKIGLELQKEELLRNIHKRVEVMMKDGLLNEVKSLHHLRHLNALQTVGYTEIFDYLDKRYSLTTAVEKIKTNTRQYAKRQMTWFRKDASIKWFKPTEFEEILNYIKESIFKK